MVVTTSGMLEFVEWAVKIKFTVLPADPASILIVLITVPGVNTKLYKFPVAISRASSPNELLVLASFAFEKVEGKGQTPGIIRSVL